MIYCKGSPYGRAPASAGERVTAQCPLRRLAPPPLPKGEAILFTILRRRGGFHIRPRIIDKEKRAFNERPYEIDYILHL